MKASAETSCQEPRALLQKTDEICKNAAQSALYATIRDFKRAEAAEANRQR